MPNIPIYPASQIYPPFEVSNSLRFDTNATMNIVPSSAGNRRKFTLSMWIKRSKLGAEQMLFWSNQNGSNYLFLRFKSDDTLDFTNQSGGSNTIQVITNQVFRDPSAWYNIIVAVDTEQSTSSNRVKIYVNGTQVSSFGTSTYGSQNADLSINQTSNNHYIGSQAAAGNYYNGYMAEVVFTDGSALSNTDVGEFDEDTGIWKPIDVSGLTFGTNGFYLDFEDSSNLGNDANGGTDLTETNIASTDQTTDTCTNNYCTLNPLDAYYESSTFSEGNCKIVTESSGYSYNTSTIGLTTGKWYCEVYIETSPHPTTKDSFIGIAGRMSEADLGHLGNYSDTYAIYGGNGNIYNNNASASYGVSHTTGDIIGIYLDLDNNKLYFAKNGTIMNSGTGKDITDVSNTKAGAYFMVAADFGNGYQGTYRMNFGNPIYTLTSGNTDANGYGNFEYDPSDGGSASFDSTAKDFLAINTKNLAEYG